MAFNECILQLVQCIEKAANNVRGVVQVVESQFKTRKLSVPKSLEELYDSAGGMYVFDRQYPK